MPKERLAIIKDFAGLTDEEVRFLENTGSLPMEVADHMVENVIGVFPDSVLSFAKASIAGLM